MTHGPAFTTVTGTIRLLSSKTWVMPSFSPRIPVLSLLIGVLALLDVHVDGGREVDAHERVDRLRRRVEDVDEPLVRAHLEVLAAVLVLVRRADDAVHVLLRRQRHRTRDLRASPRHRLDDLARRAVDDLVVVGLEPDTDLLGRHRFLLQNPGRVVTGRSVHRTESYRGRSRCRLAWSGAGFRAGVPVRKARCSRRRGRAFPS